MQADFPATSVQVHRLEPLKAYTSAQDFPRTSFLADPSTPGYSDAEWKAMANTHHGDGPSGPSQPSSMFSPSFTSPGPPPMTPKIDTFTRSDVVSKHLLIETALFDSSRFDILPIDEVDSLKQEKTKVDARIDAARRKVALESKVRDAAQSLHRLYSSKGRPASQRRMSMLASERRSSGASTASDTASQAGDELASSSKKIDELVQILIGLENRRQYIESRLLRHTAAVLQAAHAEREADMNRSLGDSGFDDDDDDDDDNDNASIRSLDESIFNGHGLAIRRVGKDTTARGDHGQQSQLSDVNLRLQMLNGQLQSLISQAKRGRSASLDPNSPVDMPSAYPEDEHVDARLNNQLEHMQSSVLTLVQEHKHINEERDNTLNQAKHQLHALEGRLESVNHQLFTLVNHSPDSHTMFDTAPPPEITGHGTDDQMQYLEETLLTVEQIMLHSTTRSDEELDSLRQAHDEHSEKAAHYEATVTGLWEILSSEESLQPPVEARNDSEQEEEDADVKEPFTLHAFSAKVQHLFQRHTNLNAQTHILRRQIQQQRELAGKADVNQINMQELELAKTREREALDELDEHRSRIEQLQDKIADLNATLSGQRDDARISATEAQAKEQESRERIEDLTATLGHLNTSKEQTEERLAVVEEDLVTLESEVVRLTTELTMAKAELDGAYGSRTDRAKDVANNPEIQAQLRRLDQLQQYNEQVAAELDQLRQEKVAQSNEMQDLMSRHQDSQARSATLENQIQEITSRHQTAEAHSTSLEQELGTLRELNASSTREDARMRALEKELADMAADYQELTRETVEVEKEREKVEQVVDNLRLRIEGLEAQLADEKVRWLGAVRANTPEPGQPAQREMTSTMVMRTEFKKMMREARAETVKLLRVSCALSCSLLLVCPSVRSLTSSCTG